MYTHSQEFIGLLENALCADVDKAYEMGCDEPIDMAEANLKLFELDPIAWIDAHDREYLMWYVHSH